MNIKLFNNMCPVCNKRLKYYVFDLFTSKNDIIRCKKCSTELTNKRNFSSNWIFNTVLYVNDDIDNG